jgi:hypothetical protein
LKIKKEKIFKISELDRMGSKWGKVSLTGSLEKNISMLERKHINYTNSLLGHNVSLPQ